MNPRKNRTTGFVPSCRPPVPPDNRQQTENCGSSECLSRNTNAGKREEIFFCQKYSERAKEVLKLLNGMNVDEAREMLRWCSDFVVNHTTINWRREVELQNGE